MRAIRKIEWDEEYEQLRLEFKGERNKLRQLLADTDKADRIRGKLEEFQGRLRCLAKLRATEQYQGLTSTETRISDALSAEQQALSIEQSLAADASTLRNLQTEALQVAEYTDRSASFNTAASLVEQAYAVLQMARASWDTRATGTAWQERVKQLNAWLAEQGNVSNLSSDQSQQDRQLEIELQAELCDLANYE